MLVGGSRPNSVTALGASINHGKDRITYSETKWEEKREEEKDCATVLSERKYRTGQISKCSKRG